MRKLRYYGLFTCGVVIVFTLSLIAFNFAQSQVKIQPKPDRPPGKVKAPEYEWSIVIVNGDFALQGGTGATVYEGDGGPGLLYDCSQTNIYSHMRVVESQGQYRTSALFEIYYPDITQGEVLYQVNFTEHLKAWDELAYFVSDPPYWQFIPPIDPDLNPDLFDEEGNFIYKRSRFPECGFLIECGLPTSIFNFLRGLSHPYQGYEKFRIDFYTEFFNEIAQGDYTQWIEYDKKKIGLGIEIHPIGLDGPYSPSVYNGVGFHTGTWDGEYGYIEKIPSSNPDTTDIWRVIFGRDIFGTPYITKDDLNVTFDEWYNEIILALINKNKAKEERRLLYSTYADCDMQFEILFIRTKK
jgi:hypothetical protein